MSKQHAEPSSVTLSVKFYRLLLRVYPASFRQEYGAWMAQVFRDSCLFASRQNRPAALPALWGRTTLDYFQSVIEQHANRGMNMTQSKSIKLSGWGLVVSGLIFGLGWFAGSRPEYSPYNAASWALDRYLNDAVTPLLTLGMVLAALGMLGIYTRFSDQVDSLGKSGLLTGLAGSVVALVGVIGLSFTDSNPWWDMTMLGVTGLFIGLVLFGIECQRKNLLARWNSLPLMTGIPWPVAILVTLVNQGIMKTKIEMPDIVIFIVLSIAFGGLVLIGYRLQADTPARQVELNS